MKPFSAGEMYLACLVVICLMEGVFYTFRDANFVTHREQAEAAKALKRWVRGQLDQEIEHRQRLEHSTHQALETLTTRFLVLESRVARVGFPRAALTPETGRVENVPTWKKRARPAPTTRPGFFYYDEQLQLVPLPEDPNDAHY